MQPMFDRPHIFHTGSARIFEYLSRFTAPGVHFVGRLATLHSCSEDE
jgi:UDP-galactopyranose mutase